MRQKHKLCNQCRFYKNDKCKERGIGTAPWEWACTLFQGEKAKIGLCECGSNRRYVARQKSMLGEILYYVRCPYCKREAGSSLDRAEAIELWNNSYGRKQREAVKWE